MSLASSTASLNLRPPGQTGVSQLCLDSVLVPDLLGLDLCHVMSVFQVKVEQSIGVSRLLCLYMFFFSLFKQVHLKMEFKRYLSLPLGNPNVFFSLPVVHYL